MVGDFVLTANDLRVVARYVTETAEELLPVFEDTHPGDPRPRAAIDAAWRFIEGDARSRLQRSASMEAHRAAAAARTESSRLAAQAAGDAASAAYLHPISKSHQVGHILRAAANAIRVSEIEGGSGAARTAQMIRRASDELVDVLRRYPPAPAGKSRVAELITTLDSALRRDYGC